MLRSYQHWALSPVSTGGTTDEPVSLAEAKSAARLDSTGTADDAFLYSLIAAGRALVERRTNRSLLQKQLDLLRDDVPCDRFIKVPMSPLVNVVSIVSFNSTNGQTTLSTDAYTVDALSEPGRILLNAGYSWPTSIRDYAGLRARVTVGYSTAAAGVPDPLRVAILQYIAYFYEHRGDGSVEVPAGILEALEPYLMPEAS